MAGRYHSYAEYKETHTQWLGKVPIHWNVLPNKYFSEMCKGKNPSTFESDYSEEGIPYLSMGYLRGQEAPKYAKTESTAVMANEGDILLLWDGSNAGEYILAKSGLVSSTMARVMANRDCVHKYYFYSCKAFEPELKQHTVGMGIPHVNGEEVRTQSFPQPPKEEQEIIANFLDHETAKIDTLIDKQQQLIKLLKEKRQAVISHAVTKGLNPAAPIKDSGVEWFGQAPEHWKIIEFKFSAEDGRKTFTDGDWVESPYITDIGVRLLQTGNVGRGFYKEQGFRYVSEDNFKALNCTEVKPGDVLICRLDGPVGRSCLAPNLNVKMITSVDNAILKPNGDFDSRFLVYLTNSTPWLDWMQDLCRVGGGFRLRISRSMLGDQRIPAPPIKEQAKIADTLDELNKLSLECIKRCEESIILLQERRTALISAAVTGKIDVRNWNLGIDERSTFLSCKGNGG